MPDPISGTVETTRNADGSIQTVRETFEVTEQAVQAVRNETPIGSNGQPINRIPLNARLVALAESGVTHKRIASEDRCLRLVTVPLHGGTEGQFHCSRACVTAGTDGEKYCPEHDKAVFAPNQSHPPRPGRTFNSASIVLTPGERTETFMQDGKKVSVVMQDGNDIGALRNAQQGVPGVQTPAQEPQAPRIRRQGPRNVVQRQPRAAKGAVRLEFTLEELAGEGVVGLFARKAVAALDELPATTIANMKNVVKIQDFLNTLYREEGK